MRHKEQLSAKMAEMEALAKKLQEATVALDSLKPRLELAEQKAKVT